MSAQAGSRWEVTDAFIVTALANVPAKVIEESARLAAKFTELELYPGSGVALQIPTVQTSQIKMDTQASVSVDMCPAIYISGQGTSTWVSAESMVGRQAFGNTPVEVAIYISGSVNYSGTQYELSERELIAVSGALGQAVVDALRAGGTDSLWQQGAGIINPQMDTFSINGYVTTDQQETTAAKVLLTLQVGHEMRY